MKLSSLGSNQTELELGRNTVLFSYSTPVAACIGDIESLPPEIQEEMALVPTCFIRTSTNYSSATSRHINKWLGGRKFVLVPQSVLDSLSS